MPTIRLITFFYLYITSMIYIYAAESATHRAV